jgi:hypothetical protein
LTKFNAPGQGAADSDKFWTLLQNSTTQATERRTASQPHRKIDAVSFQESRLAHLARKSM